MWLKREYDYNEKYAPQNKFELDDYLVYVNKFNNGSN